MARKICDPERMTQSAYEECLELRRLRRKVETQIAERLDEGFKAVAQEDEYVDEDDE